MAKKPKNESVEVGAGVNSMFAAMLKEAEKHFGTSGVYVASEREQFVEGVPIPNFALPLQYVIQNNIWPLHRTSLLAGPFGSCKTTLAFELSRWFYYADGLINYIETENKIDSMHLKAALGEGIGRVMQHSVNTVQEWQDRLTNGINFLSKMDKEQCVYPVLSIIDSITGVPTEEDMNYVKEHGHARGRTFSDMSIVLSQYFKSMVSIKDVPIHVLMINHEKRDLKQLPGGRQIEGKRKPGGDSQTFHATLDISVSKLGSINLVSRNGLKIGMKCVKNSMGETNLTGYMEVIFSERENAAGELLKSTWVDWYSSIPVFLNTCIKANRKKAVTDVLEITENGNRWSCKKLGITRALSSELGKAICADTKLFNDLQDALGIVKRENVFSGPEARVVPEPGPWYPDTGQGNNIEIVQGEADADVNENNAPYEPCDEESTQGERTACDEQFNEGEE